jgi:cell wall-associated NlpC family hydrolase
MATSKQQQKKVAPPAQPAKEAATAKAVAKVQQAELVDVSMLKPHPRNYKKHPPEQIAHLIQSIDEHGFYRNIVCARDYTILAGHGVVQAINEMGLYGPKQVPVIRIDVDADDPRAMKIMLSDNEISLSAEVDDRVLTEMLKDVQAVSSLLGTGYDKQTLAARIFASRGASEVADADAAAQWAGLPEHDGKTGTVKLVVDFESVEMRDKFVEQFQIKLNSADTTTPNVSAWWPPRNRRQDGSSLLWDADEDKQ